jgi:hypothetical protein
LALTVKNRTDRGRLSGAKWQQDLTGMGDTAETKKYVAESDGLGRDFPRDSVQVDRES